MNILIFFYNKIKKDNHIGECSDEHNATPIILTFYLLFVPLAGSEFSDKRNLFLQNVVYYSILLVRNNKECLCVYIVDRQHGEQTWLGWCLCSRKDRKETYQKGKQKNISAISKKDVRLKRWVFVFMLVFNVQWHFGVFINEWMVWISVVCTIIR